MVLRLRDIEDTHTHIIYRHCFHGGTASAEDIGSDQAADAGSRGRHMVVHVEKIDCETGSRGTCCTVESEGHTL